MPSKEKLKLLHEELKRYLDRIPRRHRKDREAQRQKCRTRE
jgi:hypothetical protein